jgi:hypothetical protein
MSDKRISRLADRFTQPDKPQPERKPRVYARSTFYVDKRLPKDLDAAWRTINHQLYPLDLPKGAFYSILMQYGLDHLNELMDQFRAEAAAAHPSDEDT